MINKNLDELIQPILSICQHAAQAILEVYQEDDEAFGVEQKSDSSPVTRADHASNAVIVSSLAAQYPDIPIISEETGFPEFEVRKTWDEYWLVDPLDGTKEFIARNDQFTINIALIRNGEPVFGVVYLPVTQVAYVGLNGVGEDEENNKQALRFDAELQAQPIAVRSLEQRISEGLPIEVVASVHHHNADTQALIDSVEQSLGKVSTVNIGSALKFCLLAEGKADFYPRHALTSEWDTAAAQAVLEAAGGCVVKLDGEPLLYNTKSCLLNPFFYAIAAPSKKWHSVLNLSI